MTAGAAAFAQQTGGGKNTQSKVNYLNVCSPSDAEKQELSAALLRLPVKTHFAPDFEISRGRTTMNEPPQGLGSVLGGSEVVNGGSSPSNWVRIRREFPPESPFASGTSRRTRKAILEKPSAAASLAILANSRPIFACAPSEDKAKS